MEGCWFRCRLHCWLVAVLLLPKNICGAGDNQILIIVAMDGFKADYLNYSLTPNLQSVRRNGISVPFMRNAFPTKTFPNHFSIATGLYPEHHGVVSSELYDIKIGGLQYGYDMFHLDETITPIWTLNELAGGHSGCMMFPGTNFPYRGKNCTFTELLNMTESFDSRIGKVLEWISHPKTPANLIMLYFEQPDAAGHIYSPDSGQVKNEIAHVDKSVGLILASLESAGLRDRANLIFLSDHGMVTVPVKNVIDLSPIINNSSGAIYGTSPVLQIVPKPDHLQSVLASLRTVAATNKHFKVYTNDELPAKWHFRNDRRVGPITAVASLGYAFHDLLQTAQHYADDCRQNITQNSIFGVHGYENDNISMYGVFLAVGPKLKRQFLGKPFDNVDLYYLFCEILSLTAPKGLDGKPNTAHSFMETNKNIFNIDSKAKTASVYIIGLAIACLVSLGIIGLALKRYKKHRQDTSANNELNKAFSCPETEKLMQSFSDGGDDY